jgi:hypothetical protein
MTKTLGSGNPKKICVLFLENGLGDAICMLPALWQKIQDGFDVTYYGRDFTFLKKLGIEIHGEDVSGVLGTIEKLQKEFGVIYGFGKQFSSLRHEGITGGVVLQTRFEQFAECLETTVPKEFDFKQFFEITEGEKKEIVISLYSNSRSRRYALELDVNNEFWGAYNEGCIDYPPKFIGQFMQEPEKDLVNTIYNAKAVVTIDNGVLHLAMALGVPTVALFGGSDEWSIVHQYRRFGMMKYRVVRSDFRDKECQRPCSFQKERGYQVNGKCGVLSDCLHEITAERILEEVQTLLKEI